MGKGLASKGLRTNTIVTYALVTCGSRAPDSKVEEYTAFVSVIAWG